MSDPNIPDIDPNITLTKEQATTLLLASIAMEELGLAHILNAEGEKIQFALESLSEMEEEQSIDDILKVNDSVKEVLALAMKNQMFLDDKLGKVTGMIKNDGHTGPPGPPGEQGPPGDEGPPGLDGIGAILPYSSGAPVELTGLVGNVLGTAAAVGMGFSAANIQIVGTTIDLTGALGTALNFAPVIPRDGTITDFSAFFSVVGGLSILSAPTIRAMLLKSQSPTSNIFSEVTSFNLSPSLNPAITIGETCTGRVGNLNESVVQGERILVLFGVTSSVATEVIGYASAGVAIS